MAAWVACDGESRRIVEVFYLFCAGGGRRRRVDQAAALPYFACVCAAVITCRVTYSWKPQWDSHYSLPVIINFPVFKKVDSAAGLEPKVRLQHSFGLLNPARALSLVPTLVRT